MEISSNSTGKVTIFITSSSGEVYRISSQELTNNTFVLSSSIIGTLNADTYTINVTQEEGTNHNAVTTATTKALTIAKVNVSQLVASTITAPTYTGEALTPSVTFTYAEKAVSTSEYTLAYSNNVNAGTNTGIITVTGNNINFTGEATINFSIAKANISSTTIADIPEQSFNGDEVKPTLTITYNGKTLVENTDYSLTYSNNTSIGTGTVVIEGLTNFTGTTTKTFAIKQGLENATFSTIADATYNKGAHTPTPTVTLGGTTLVKDTDYTISYSNNTNAGTATVTITGKGNYTGTASTTFTINPIILDESQITKPTIPSYLEGSQATYQGGYAKDENNNEILGKWIVEDSTKKTFPTGEKETYAHYLSLDFVSNDGNYVYYCQVQTTMLAVAYINTTYYGTIEKALVASSNSTVYVIVGRNPIIRSTCEIKEGTTLILPYSSDGSYNGRQRGENKGDASGNNIWYDDISTNAFADTNEAYYRTLNVTIAKGITLTNNGTLFVGGITGWEGQKLAGQTSGFYAQITMDENSKILNTGTLTCLGYIKDLNASKPSLGVESTSGTVSAPFVIHDYRGGSSTVGAYAASNSGGVNAFNAKNQPGNIFPFNRFNMPNIATLTIHYGASLIGYGDLYTPKTTIASVYTF